MDSKTELQFIQNMRILRHRNKLNQEEFATMIGVKRSRVGAWEERRACPPLGLMVKICNLFNVSLDEMVGREIKGGAINQNEVITRLERELRKLQTALKTIKNIAA